MPKQIKSQVFLAGAAAVLAAAVAAGSPAGTARAQEPEVIKRLRSETVTLFDAGLKRLRRSVIDASGRLGSQAEPGPITRVFYDSKGDTIEMEFRFTDVSGEVKAFSMARCLDRHKAAVRETFQVGKTITAEPLTFEERARRRLGNFFIREPVQSINEIVALGQALSEVTFLKIEIVNKRNDVLWSCRDRIAPPTGTRR